MLKKQMDEVEVVKVEPLLVDTHTACQMLGIRRTSLFGYLRDGTLQRRKRGRKTVIPMASIKAFAEQEAL